MKNETETIQTLTPSQYDAVCAESLRIFKADPEIEFFEAHDLALEDMAYHLNVWEVIAPRGLVDTYNNYLMQANATR